MAADDLEAKIVVLGASGVGKTSLLTRFAHNTFLPPSQQPPTLGASFLAKRLVSPDHSNTIIRLQIWDTAGQERFRSISKLYYRGANAAILCYDITDERSFEEMQTWVEELRANMIPSAGEGAASGGWGDCIVHVVGTKADVVAEDPKRREVPFERCVNYVSEHLQQQRQAAADAAASPPLHNGQKRGSRASLHKASSVSPNLDSAGGFWGSGWDCCHEISAKEGEGVEEVFRVIMRNLVEQKNRQDQLKEQQDQLRAGGLSAADATAQAGQVDAEGHGLHKRGSFRLGIADKRLSWFGGMDSGTPTPGGLIRPDKGGRCC